MILFFDVMIIPSKIPNAILRTTDIVCLEIDKMGFEILLKGNNMIHQADC